MLISLCRTRRSIELSQAQIQIRGANHKKGERYLLKFQGHELVRATPDATDAIWKSLQSTVEQKRSFEDIYEKLTTNPGNWMEVEAEQEIIILSFVERIPEVSPVNAP